MSRQIAWEMWRKDVAAVRIEAGIKFDSVVNQVMRRDALVELIEERIKQAFLVDVSVMVSTQSRSGQSNSS